MSRIPAVSSSPSSVSIGDRLISTGNSVPSLRAPWSSMPEPIGRNRGEATNPATCWWWRGRTVFGTSMSIDVPISSSRR